MARTNKISADFTAANKTAVMTKINELKALMPFLIALSEIERGLHAKMGPKSVAYVKQCLEGALAFPNELKASFSIAEFQKDAVLLENLLGVSIALTSVLELVNDTLISAGIDAMGASSEVYDSLKSSAKSNANVKATVALIGERYAGQKKPRVKKTP